MHSFQTRTIREIALEAPVTTRVFEQFKIDYCCHGDTLFDEACLNAGTTPDVVIEKIENVLREGRKTGDERFTEMPLRELITHILDTHHVFTRSEMQQLMPLMAKVARRHGEHYQYLIEMEHTFNSLCDELWPHMEKEEKVLFPYIEDLERSMEHGRPGIFPPFGTVEHPVRMMMSEHELAGELLAKLRELSDDYTLPEGACPSFTALYHRLEAFEKDLHQHIHLENNLVFPKASELERRVFAAAAV
ncbi:MAG: iron-sulfur cluster repair di-iron protein [Acidobacteria bacterium]|nr:iron-sulfur cluster repair di-iron protein [Acidobacteriota bacterium]